MSNNISEEKARQLIYGENVNVTNQNPLKELANISFKLFLIIICVYYTVFFTSGIILKTLSAEKQIMLEKMISQNKPHNAIELTEEEQQKLTDARDRVLEKDNDFPKTSNLNIAVVKSDVLNAVCHPNGNIYITSALYDKIKDDEEVLTFLIAHEMAHYRHRDHLFMLRRNIANGIVILLLSTNNSGTGMLTTFVSQGFEISDLSYSRSEESNADKYAVNMANRIYGNSNSGERLMNILKATSYKGIDIFSTHPNMDKRIKYIKKHSY